MKSSLVDADIGSFRQRDLRVFPVFSHFRFNYMRFRCIAVRIDFRFAFAGVSLVFDLGTFSYVVDIFNFIWWIYLTLFDGYKTFILWIFFLHDEYYFSI